jgi:hypothetical protein
MPEVKVSVLHTFYHLTPPWAYEALLSLHFDKEIEAQVPSFSNVPKVTPLAS